MKGHIAACSGLCAALFAAPALAADGPSGPNVAAIAAVSAVLILMGALTYSILTTRRMAGSSLFNRLFVIVAVTSGVFSAVSSAIGFSLITSQETEDVFRNSVLPPAFGVFVFFLAVAIWVGGAELVRHRDWFRGIGRGFISDMLFFVERSLKIFVIIPILATILFFVSTWTTVVGIGGVDAVRHTYAYELTRLQTECTGITAYKREDLLFQQEISLALAAAKRAAEREEDRGIQSGLRGSGPVADYIDGVANWLAGIDGSVENILDGKQDPTGRNPFDPDICAKEIAELNDLLAENAFENYDAWASEFESRFENFVTVLNRWRHDRRLEDFLELQLAGFDRANPQPESATANQKRAMTRYANEMKEALEKLVRKRKLVKPPVPVDSAAEMSPERGLEIFTTWFRKEPPEPQDEERVSRRASVVASEFVAPLSVITPRDAVLKNANIFSDVWALAIAWDYAAYVLMLAFLFFPSAERARGFKDD